MFGIPEWAIGVGFIMLVISLAKAMTAWTRPAAELPGRKASRRDLAQALEDVQRRLGEVEAAQRRLGETDDVQARLAEVEERLDFTERLLTKQRDAERRIPG